MAEMLKSKAYSYRMKPPVLGACGVGCSALACMFFYIAMGEEYGIRIGPMRFGRAASIVIYWLLGGGAACSAAYYLALLLCQLRFKHRLLIGTTELQIPLSQFSGTIVTIPYDRIESVEVRMDARHRLTRRAKSILFIRLVFGHEYQILEKYLAGPKTFIKVHTEILNRLAGPERQETAESLTAMAGETSANQTDVIGQ